MSLPLRVVLRDLNPELTGAWEKSFSGVAGVEVCADDFFSDPADAVVSPANSFGVMDGGLDLAIRSTLPGIEPAVQARIVAKYHGEIPVGCAEVVETSHSDWPYLVCAPTMRVPENISRTLNAYLAMRAILIAVLRFNAEHGPLIKTLVIPGLGTGVGRMSPTRCASQMRLAYDLIAMPPGIPGFHAIQSTHIRLLSE